MNLGFVPMIFMSFSCCLQVSAKLLSTFFIEYFTDLWFAVYFGTGSKQQLLAFNQKEYHHLCQPAKTHFCSKCYQSLISGVVFVAYSCLCCGFILLQFDS